ncbi:MAG: ARMT1-like domain-containing protein [Thermodesulfovibrionales bacterium]|nr:ARMT1-like domain-containing protein [Thermodesulfovibrionales bacterium]
MKTTLDCFPCFLKQTVIALKLSQADEALQKEVLYAVSDEIKLTDLSKPPAWTTTFIHKRIREILKRDPFREVKREYNQIALSLYPELRSMVERSSDPLWTATRLAIAGNVIDFGIYTAIDIESTIHKAINGGLAIDHFDLFRKEVSSAREILYLLDNAGEIVFDRILIEVLKSMGKKTIAVVKAAPVLNDCTITDAEETGLSRLTDIMDNGSDAIGTILEFCSPAFRKTFEKTPLIISKGQGNFETLNASIVNREIKSKNIFFLFQSKCEVVSKALGLPVGSMILSSSQISA